MTRTSDCIRGWVELLIDGSTDVQWPLRASSCHASGYYMISYETPIAKFCGDHFLLATKKYSNTTTRQQNLLRKFIPKEMLVEVEEITMIY